MADQAAGWPQPATSAKSGSNRSRDLSAMTDLELMELLKCGDHDALSGLFDRYFRMVLNIANKILRDRSESEDVMQEVFLDLYRRACRFDSAKGTPKSWVVTVAYHKSLNRRKYLALRTEFDGRQIDEFDPETVSESFFCRGPGDGSPESRDLLAIVHQGLATLTPKQREVVQLACLEGYLLSEIADRTKESYDNIRHHYYRGIGKLREFVKEKSSSTPGGPAAFNRGGK